MKFDFSHPDECAACFAALKQYLATLGEPIVRYIDLGVKTIRVLAYTPEILSHMERQLTYTLRKTAETFSDTLVVFKLVNAEQFARNHLGAKFDPKRNLRLRLEMLYQKGKYPLHLEASIINQTSPFLFLRSGGVNDVLEAYDEMSNTLYYGVADFAPEEFIKLGHIFIQQLNVFLRETTANIAHGAIVGFENNGVLFCARGQRGKSTLTVHAMLQGFDYVSDDYQILNQTAEGLFSYPIYSIITLSPTMYNELYDNLKGKFVSNNARKDKYVINIAEYHDQFRSHYPLRLAIFPEIVTKPHTEIYPCSPAEKGRAIVQLIQSTVMQMRDLNHTAVIRKMLNMVQVLPFYKVDLCRTIAENTKALRTFLAEYDFYHPALVEPPRMMVDITFDLANILDGETCVISSLNKFATNVYENLLLGRTVDEVRVDLASFTAENPNLLAEFACLVHVLSERNLLDVRGVGENATRINPEFAKECNYKFSFLDYTTNETKEVVKL